MTHTATVYQRAFAPLVIKQLLIECDIPQKSLADRLKVSRATVNNIVNRGEMPRSIPNFRSAVEKALLEFPYVQPWLAEHSLVIAGIWQLADQPRRRNHPVGAHRRQTTALIPGNPELTNEEDKQMRKLRIPEAVLKHFRLFRDPFLDDPRSEKEVFRSDDHRYLEYAMYDAALNSGLIAVIAEVGAGKTVMRREVIERLRADEKVRVVFPQIIDRSRVTAGSICDAIIMDLSNERPKVKLEDKSRQVRRLLSERVAQGKQVCLIIEEAHRLTVPALKHLKVFHEIEEGRRKLLSIILLGQTELGMLLDEEQYPELRELSRRIQIAAIPGLGDATWDYLTLKFSIVGGDIKRVVEDTAVTELVARLSARDPATGKRYSQAYPLTVNNYMTKAMILAMEMGHSIITDEVIHAL